MTIRDRIRRAYAAFTLNDLDKEMDAAISGVPALSGTNVSADTALTFSAFFCGVMQIAQTVASLPFPIYRRRSDTERERDRTHHLWRPLNRQAGPYMTAFTWRETMTHHAIVWGNGYSLKLRDRAGRVTGFTLLNPERTRVATQDGVPVYIHRGRDNQDKTLAFEEVFHLPGLGFDGLRGYSLLSIARESLGLGLALQEFGARFFGQGTNLGGIIKRPREAPRLSQEAATRLEEELRRKWEGLKRSHGVIVLEEGSEFEKVGMPLDDAQFLASKQFSIQDMARWLNMPPHKLKDLTRSSFSNIEQEQLSWLVDTIRPWLVRWETATNTWLVEDYDAEEVYAEHVVDALLRGDISTRYAALTAARQNGIINANEWRAMENWNPIAGPAGDEYLVQGAMIPTATAGQTKAAPPAPPDTDPESPEEGAQE
jgi:HK97 family phage portal protein